jgi:hypothetical protein
MPGGLQAEPTKTCQSIFGAQESIEYVVDISNISYFFSACNVKHFLPQRVRMLYQHLKGHRLKTGVFVHGDKRLEQ